MADREIGDSRILQEEQTAMTAAELNEHVPYFSLSLSVCFLSGFIFALLVDKQQLTHTRPPSFHAQN